MGSGGNLGVMQITRVAQSCYLGNKAEFVIGTDYESPKKVHWKEFFLGSENVKSTILTV